MRRQVGRWAAFVGASLLLGACSRGQPDGQVIATVDGEDITQQELNTELQGTNISSGVNKQAAQRALLQRVIERKLMDKLASDKGVDKSPEYLAQKRRLEEVLLVQLYARQQMDGVAQPSGTDIARFMKENPGIFANRQQLVLDQIRFPQPADRNALNGIDGVHSMAGVASFLTAKGIRFDRQTTGLDSAAVPAGLLAQIDRQPAGEPFVVPTNGLLTVNVVTGRRPIANDPAQARAVAASAWRQQKVRQAIADQLAAARKEAKIEYQPGFAPDTKPAGAGAGR